MNAQSQEPRATGEVAQKVSANVAALVAEGAHKLLRDISTKPVESLTAADVKNIVLDELMSLEDASLLLAYAAQIETPEQVAVEYVKSIAAGMGAEFGGYGSFQLGATRYTSGDFEIQYGGSADGLEKAYSGGTMAEFLAKCRAESKPDLAAQKRAEAARLLAEADKLDPKPATAEAATEDSKAAQLMRDVLSDGKVTLSELPLLRRALRHVERSGEHDAEATEMINHSHSSA